MNKMEYQTISNTKFPRTLLLKGAPGSGKTTLAAQLPGVVIFDFDNNLAALQKLPEAAQKKIRRVTPKTGLSHKTQGNLIWNRFVGQLEEVMDDDSVETVVIDSLTTLADCLMDFIVGSSQPTANVQIQHWGAFGRYLKWLGDSLLCADGLDKNIVVIAHEQLIMDSLDDSVKYTLNIGGRMKDSFELYFTDCWRLQTRGVAKRAPDYLVQVTPGSRYSAKCSIPGLPPEFKFQDQKELILRVFHESIPQFTLPTSG
jgi:hypothetical protein